MLRFCLVVVAEHSQLYTASAAAVFASKHPDYSLLAGRVYVAVLHKYTPESFSDWAIADGRRKNLVLLSVRG